jgi:hypothetical protein
MTGKKPPRKAVGSASAGDAAIPCTNGEEYLIFSVAQRNDEDPNVIALVIGANGV